MKSVEIEDETWHWLMDHKTAEHQTISDMIRMLIDEYVSEREELVYKT
ncbi:MAG: hypothetical protein K8R11_10360 [Methanococcoides sp.]|jgi:predicted CopG family antitoxin|nr:hypothetical protein [Methanococcoides sp.]